MLLVSNYTKTVEKKPWHSGQNNMIRLSKCDTAFEVLKGDTRNFDCTKMSSPPPPRPTFLMTVLRLGCN